ncbi:MAG: hypothetical protein ABII90_10130 [Bacteroidota bacterium]
MKKFYQKIALFSMGLALIFLIVALIPIDKRLRYQNLENDCFNQGIWIHDRIFLNPRPIDIAFIGSSHTINGINDELIESNIQGQNLKVANLGYCRLGRNFSYSLVKDILKSKKPKWIIIEVREDEDRYSHPIFPYIADEKDVFLPYLLFNRDFINDYYHAFLYKLQLLQDAACKKDKYVPERKNNYGFASSQDTASSELLNEYKLKRSKPKPKLSQFQKNFYMVYPRRYLKKINTLVKEQHGFILFLYFPSYGSNLDKPLEYDTYKEYGEVLIPPKEIFNDQNNWYNENHLNKTGANALTNWLSEQINRMETGT